MSEEKDRLTSFPMPQPIRPTTARGTWVMLTAITVLVVWSVGSVFLPTVRAVPQGGTERELLAKGEYKEAIVRLEQLVARTPDNREAGGLLRGGRLATRGRPG